MTYLCAGGRAAHAGCTVKTQVSVGDQDFFPLQINGDQWLNQHGGHKSWEGTARNEYKAFLSI